MINDNNVQELLINAGVPSDQILIDEPMAGHTTFRVGGPADVFVTVNNADELRNTLRVLDEEGIKHFLIGNGSNLLFTDDGYDGVVISLGGEFEKLYIEEDKIHAGSAVMLSRVASFACENGLTGMEPVSGIPGSIGGAVFMNAGAYGGEMKDIIESVELLARDGKYSYTASNEDMGFTYRHSAIQDNGAIVTEVVIALEPGDPEVIRACMREFAEKRNSKQPITYPSAGSTFKRPVGGYAAALIDEAGLKGTSVGGAQVSEKHAGFVINTGGATATDVLELMEIIKIRVFENSGIQLEPEVRIIGR